MIKIYKAPALFRVTICTIFFGVILYIEVRFMDIGMAIVASKPYIFEAPTLRFFVAGIAWNSKMGAFQWKITGIVLFDGIGKLSKSFCAVASGTIRRYTLFRELAFMVVGMTICAAGVFQGIGKSGGFVA